MHTKAASVRDRALGREVPDMVTAPAADDDARPVPAARVHDDGQRGKLDDFRPGRHDR